MSQDSRSSREIPRAELLQALTDEIRSARAAQSRVEDGAARALGLNRTDFRCIDIVDRHRGITAGELARQTGLTTGAVTAVLDRLERDGHVRRVRDPEDRRRVVVEVTPEARARIGKLYGPLAREGAALLDRYSDDELRAVLQFVRTERELNTSLAERLEPGVREPAELRAIVREQVREILEATEAAKAAGRGLKGQVKEAKAEIKAQLKGTKAELKAEAKAIRDDLIPGRRRRSR